MADFNQYLPMLLRFEGGWVDNPADPGGATNLGITWRTFHIFAEKILKIAPTLQNLKRLTDEQAGKIYKTEYWDAIYGDDIEHQLLADMICDFYVNAGWHAITILLKVLNRNGANFHISMRITPKVIEVINKMDAQKIYMEYKHARIAYYENLALENKSLHPFLLGWLNRVNSFPSMPAKSTGIDHSSCTPLKKQV